jgi:hypothetical protein
MVGWCSVEAPFSTATAGWADDVSAAPVTSSTARTVDGGGATTATSAVWSRGAYTVVPIVLSRGAIGVDSTQATEVAATDTATSGTLGSKIDESANTHSVTASRISRSLLRSSVASMSMTLLQGMVRYLDKQVLCTPDRRHDCSSWSVRRHRRRLLTVSGR